MELVADHVSMRFRYHPSMSEPGPSSVLCFLLNATQPHREACLNYAVVTSARDDALLVTDVARFCAVLSRTKSKWYRHFEACCRKPTSLRSTFKETGEHPGTRLTRLSQLQCTLKTIGSSTCELTNITCIKGDDELLKELSVCVKSGCSIREALSEFTPMTIIK